MMAEVKQQKVASLSMTLGNREDDQKKANVQFVRLDDSKYASLPWWPLSFEKKQQYFIEMQNFVSMQGIAFVLPCEPGLIYDKPWYQPLWCYHSACFNQANCYRDLKLKLVVGSFGVGGIDGHPSWLYGPKALGQGSSTSVPAHVWLTDSKGGIYDCIYNAFVVEAKNRKLTIHCAPGVIAAASLSDLARQGICYAPFSKKNQQAFLKQFADQSVRL